MKLNISCVLHFYIKNIYVYTRSYTGPEICIKITYMKKKVILQWLYFINSYRYQNIMILHFSCKKDYYLLRNEFSKNRTKTTIITIIRNVYYLPSKIEIGSLLKCDVKFYHFS